MKIIWYIASILQRIDDKLFMFFNKEALETLEKYNYNLDKMLKEVMKNNIYKEIK